jgi:hypothetical protein
METGVFLSLGKQFDGASNSLAYNRDLSALEDFLHLFPYITKFIQ